MFIIDEKNRKVFCNFFENKENRKTSRESSLKDTHKVNCETNICIDQKTYLLDE